MSDNRYNGWDNYETWLVKLWIDNDQGSQEYWQERAEELHKNSETPAADLADELKTSHEDGLPELEGVFSDLLNAALGSVNWYEIAENMLSDVSDDDAEEAA